MCLALPWLETMLDTEGLGVGTDFWDTITSVKKLSRVVLPVFFGKADACLVTRRGFDLLAELNPQVGDRLRAIAVSPEVVPVVMFFRTDYAPPSKDSLLDALSRLHETPAGQQVLTVFQIDRLEEYPTLCLDSARQLMAGYSRIQLRTAGSRPRKLAQTKANRNSFFP